MHYEVWHMQCLFIRKLGSSDILPVPIALFPSELRGFKSEQEDILEKTQRIHIPAEILHISTPTAFHLPQAGHRRY